MSKVYLVVKIHTEGGCAFPTEITTDTFETFYKAKERFDKIVADYKAFDFIDGSDSNIITDTDTEFMSNTDYDFAEDNYAVWVLIKECEVK